MKAKPPKRDALGTNTHAWGGGVVEPSGRHIMRKWHPGTQAL